ncbi:CD63 antigen-like [Cydia amplana]|uniref:CD63 antigen-like n=1 Tax=Cydia amplana TaxID=1869771 RepID=UPI002FE58193
MVAQTNLEVGMKCIKYMLFCVTAIFVITSALIISVGTTIYAIYHDVSFFLDPHFFSPATLVIVIGVMMLFISMFGCIGAWRESTCLVNIFAVILSLVFILEVAAAIAAYSLRSQVIDMVDDRLRIAMPYYYENQEVTDAFDFIQNRLNCCGVDTYFDWHMVEPPQGATGIVVSNITVPNSCCAESHYTVVEDVTVAECTKLFANGCLPRVIYLVYQSAGLLGAGAMTIAFIQLIGIVFSFSLGSAIRKAKTERERRRQEIQSSVINSHTSLNPDGEKIKPIVYVPFYGQTDTAA